MSLLDELFESYLFDVIYWLNNIR